MFRYSKWSFLREIGVWVYVLFSLSPLYILINVAIKGNKEAIATPGYIPAAGFSLDGWNKVMEKELAPRLFGSMLTSLTISAIAVTGLIFIGSITAYVIARRTNRLSKFAFYMVLTSIILPHQLGTVPVYIGAKNLGLLGSAWGMGILYIYMLMPLSIFLFSGFVRSIPTEYEEAAYIDGASRIRAYFQIVFPMLAPATGTVAIMTGLITWNDFFTPLVFMAGSDTPTLALMIYEFVGGITTSWNVVFVILILAMLPMTIIYLIFQKKFMQGFAGGLKS